MTAPASASTLHNLATDFCLAVAGVPPNNQKVGAGLVAWPCDGTPGQQWFLNTWGTNLPDDPPSNGSALGYWLVNNAASDRLLTTKLPQASGLGGPYPYVVDGGPVFVSTSNPSALVQQWELHMQTRDDWGHACYYIESRADTATAFGGDPITYPEEVLGVAGGKTAKGTAVITWRRIYLSDGKTPDVQGHKDQYWCVYN